MRIIAHLTFFGFSENERNQLCSSVNQCIAERGLQEQVIYSDAASVTFSNSAKPAQLVNISGSQSHVMDEIIKALRVKGFTGACSKTKTEFQDFAEEFKLIEKQMTV